MLGQKLGHEVKSKKKRVYTLVVKQSRLRVATSKSRPIMRLTDQFLSFINFAVYAKFGQFSAINM